MQPLQFMAYHRLGDTPNVIVDGSPTASTRLTLSHWPGSPTPTALQDDLSAQIAFHALDSPDVLDGIEVVSNNHFDQDGLASAYALVDPEAALARRAQVIDVASAGDFAVFEDRASMRIAMALAAYDDPDRSPLGQTAFGGGYEDQCAALYEGLLPRFTELLDHPDRVRSLWAAEDAHLTESLAAIEAGVIRHYEAPDLDLAVFVVPDEWAARAATRFTIGQQEALHPAATTNGNPRMRVVVSQGRHHRIEMRYETWVMFRSRPLAPRVDLRPLAERLNQLEGRDGWRADPPGALTPKLTVDDQGSDLDLARFESEVRLFLATAKSAWNPFSRT